MLIAAKLYQSTIDLAIHIRVDSTQTVLEHHRFFIQSTLVSQLEEKKPRAATGELNPGSSALAAGALATELWLPTASQAISLA